MNIPLWYLEEKTLVTILKVFNKLNKDLKEKVIKLIVLQIPNEEFENRFPIEYILIDYEEIIRDDMSTSDYYFSE